MGLLICMQGVIDNNHLHIRGNKSEKLVFEEWGYGKRQRCIILGLLSINASTFYKSAKESFSSSYFKTTGNSNSLYSSYTDVKISQPNSLLASPNWGPLTGSPLTGKSNLFTDENLSSSFFDKVTFIGAFRSDVSVDDWTAGWPL